MKNVFLKEVCSVKSYAIVSLENKQKYTPTAFSAILLNEAGQRKHFTGKSTLSLLPWTFFRTRRLSNVSSIPYLFGHGSYKFGKFSVEMEKMNKWYRYNFFRWQI